MKRGHPRWSGIVLGVRLGGLIYRNRGESLKATYMLPTCFPVRPDLLWDPAVVPCPPLLSSQDVCSTRGWNGEAESRMGRVLSILQDMEGGRELRRSFQRLWCYSSFRPWPSLIVFNETVLLGDLNLCAYLYLG